MYMLFMLNRFVLFLPLITIINLSVVAVSGQEQQWSTYKNPDFGISLQYPANWNVTEYNTSMLDVTHAIVDFNTVNTSVGISSEELFSNATVKEHAREEYNQVKDLKGFQRISDDSIMIDGIPAWKLESQVSAPGFIGKATDIWFIKDNMAFEIRYSTNDPNDYNKNYPIFQKMISTFHVIPTNE